MIPARYSATGALVIALSLAVGGCAKETDQATAPTKSASATDVRDVSKWRPSFTPTSPPVSAAEEAQSRLDYVNQILRGFNLPEYGAEEELPEVVRTVSAYDAGEAIAQCLNQGGFPATSVGGAVEIRELVEEQKTAYNRLYAECAAQYPIEPKFFREWGEDQWKVNYEYLTGYYIPCVESFGVEIDKTSIPSERVYVENALSNADLWHPAGWRQNPDVDPQLRDDHTEQGAALANACRQTPPTKWLFGD